MTKKIQGLLLLLLVGLARPAHALFGRDSVDATWPTAAVHIDGRAVEWQEMPLLDEDGIGFRAMNDAANLYLLIEGTAGDGRLLLSGKSGQSITLWFIKPDGKTKDWGIHLDFSQEEDPSVESPAKLSDWGLAAQKVIQQGLEVSTAPFPAEIEFVADLSSQRGRQPAYEMRIPLALLAYKGKSIDADFVATEITYERRAQLLSLPAPQAPVKLNQSSGESGGVGGAGGGGGGRHHHGGGAPGGGSASSATDLPKRLNLHLRIGLTKEPKHS